jgi:ferric-dicitrate binding protein FerR (iron transport regulator)
LLTIFFNHSNIEISTNAGEIKTISLLDGSKVYINSLSSISYNDEFNIENRNIKLEGEAYFEIVKNPFPFIIKSTIGNIEVLGTSFNIKDRPEGFELGVNEGSVRLKTKFKSQELKKGDYIQISEINNHILNKTYSEYPSWKYEKIFCNKRSLAQVCLELERIFGVVIKISKPELKTLTVSGIIDVKNLDDALNTLSILSQCKFKFDGEKYTILEI